MKLALVLVTGLAACGLAYAQSDDFNRPDSTNMGPNWTEVSGDWRIENQQARSSPGGSTDLMTFSNFHSTQPTVQADVYYLGSARVAYAALVSQYQSLTQNLFIKIQDNDASGDFERVFFYQGNNGGAWPGMTGGNYFADVAPFTSARVWTVVNGTDITLNIDRDMNGVPEDSLTRGNIPAGGDMVGLGGFGNAAFDNLMVPEPLTLTSLLLLVCLRRR